MKTLKYFTNSLMLLCLIILINVTGCKSNPVSTIAEPTSVYRDQIANPDTALIEHSFSSGFKINPGETIYLNYNNTELILIEKYTVSNCIIDRRDLIIRASNMPLISNLPCDWDSGPGLLLEDLSIKNVSGSSRKIQIKMDGYTLNFNKSDTKN